MARCQGQKNPTKNPASCFDFEQAYRELFSGRTDYPWSNRSTNGSPLLSDYNDLVVLNAETKEMTHYMPYVFGVDPIWRWSSELIKYTNSLKMKMAVILGVSQMTFGIVLKILNFAH